MRASRLLVTSCLTGLAAIAAVTAGAPAASAATGPSGVRARYASVANAATGTVIWSRSSVNRVPMGSITKVMTAYVVIEAGNLNRLITVPSGITAYDRKYGASTAGLKPGQRLTARDLLYALIVASGCDAAFTLANAYGGRTAFIAKMNQTAAKLGLSKTHFTDPSGLPDPTETSTYSTARDLVSLGRDAMRLPLFASIAARPKYTLAGVAGEHPAYMWTSLNPLFGHYSGTTGIKTGSTAAAGDCLLFEAVRSGKTVIGIVLDDGSWTTVRSDAGTLLNYGFAHY